MDTHEIMTRIRQAPLLPLPHPRLLTDPAQLPLLRTRADRYPGMVDGVLARARQAMSQPTDRQASQYPYDHSSVVAGVAQAWALTGDPSMPPWIRRETMAMLDVDTWVVPVHRDHCPDLDHAAANTAANAALAYDLTESAFSKADREALVAGLRRLHFEPFLKATCDPCAWWFKPGYTANWKIMTCGESGLAICGFAEHWPESREALARAAEGVLEVLDAVPPEGDWAEGISYWFGTLHFGLRYALALRRLTGGAVNLFEHPALRRTCDFLVGLTTPAGRIYNFNDNVPEFENELGDDLAILAVETGRDDWLALARLHPAGTLLFLGADDPARRADTPPYMPAAFFRTTGAGTLRAGPGPKALFVGLKCGPSAVSHSHLDANSFVIEAGGQPLAIDPGIWPYAHFIGFFDNAGPRWNFDANATVGHSSLLVDGQGQTFGEARAGRLIEARELSPGVLRAAGDASLAYPGLLTKFIRTVLLLAPDAVVIRDVIECEGDRHVEWLLHYAGGLRDDGAAVVIENGGVSLRVTPFLPDRANGWRVSNVTRTSVYECSNTRAGVTRDIRYRSFSPLRAAARFEFLFGLQVGGTPDGWQFTPGEDCWRLRLAGRTTVIRPEGDGLNV